MLLEMLKPRQSLFDALNITPEPGLTIRMDQEGAITYPGTLIVSIEGETVASLTNGQSYATSSGSVTLNVTDMEDYDALIRITRPDGSVAYEGTLDGTGYITVDPISEILLYKFEYSGTTSQATAFEGAAIPRAGIFATIKALTGADYFSDVMDQDYLMDHSGTKAISNAVLMHLIKYGEDVEGAPVKVLSKQSVIDLCRQILNRFADAWDKIYTTLQAEYNPLENYNMKEEVKPDTYDQEDIPAGWNKQTKREVNQNVSVSDSGSHNQTDVWGFNSSTGVPSAKVTTDGTVTTSGDADDNYETVTETEVTGRKKLHKGSVQTERSGNIGVTTSQQMAQAEIDLRIKNHMEDIIFRDVDQVLTTEGYAPILSPSINLI